MNITKKNCLHSLAFNHNGQKRKNVRVNEIPELNTGGARDSWRLGGGGWHWAMDEHCGGALMALRRVSWIDVLGCGSGGGAGVAAVYSLHTRRPITVCTL